MTRTSRALLLVLASALLVLAGLAAPATAASYTTVSGRVVDAGGDPIRGVQVWVSATGSKYDYLGGTNSLGQYSTPHAMSHASGASNLVFVDTAENFAGDFLAVHLNAGENNAIADVALVPGATVKGTVTAPSGTPLKNVGVVLADNNSAIDPDYADVTTATDGTYVAKPLGTGHFDVLLDVNGYRPSRPTIEIADATEIMGQNVVTKVPVAASFTGSSPSKRRVTLKVTVSAAKYGITNPGGKVTVYDGSRAIKSNVTLVGGRATISLSGLKKGTHKLKVRYLGATDTLSRYTSVRSVKVK